MSDPLDAVVWPLRTERLCLRRATPADAETAWRWRGLPEVYAWVTTAAVNRDAFVEHYGESIRIARTLMIEFDGVVVGDLMVFVQDAWGQTEVQEDARDVEAELGWTLDPAYGGRGIATEAVRAALTLCFEDLGLRRVFARCFAANTASWRLMERVGMRREAYAVQDSLHRSGVWMDGLTYALLGTEWAERRP